MKPLARLFSAVRAWLAGAPGWVGGMLAGIQAAAFSFGVVLLPAWAAAATAPLEAGIGPDWGGAASAAAGLWLLGFGVPWEIDGVVVSLPPLGVPLLAALMIGALARRFADKTWTSWLLVVASFAALIALATTLALAGQETMGDSALGAGLVAAAIAAPSAAFGIWRAHGAEFGWMTAIPTAVRRGVRLGVGLVGAHVLLAALVGAAWTVAGRHAIAELATSLAPDAVGGVTLAALETLFVPTLVVWYMAWSLGIGFSVGLAHFAPAHLVESPLPQIPLLGALPTAAGGALTWMPLVVVALALAVRLALRSRLGSALDRLASGGVAVACVAGATAVLGSLAEGAIGPGTLAASGVEWGPFVGLSVAFAAAGLALAELVEAGLRMLGIGAAAHKPMSSTRIRTAKAESSSEHRTRSGEQPPRPRETPEREVPEREARTPTPDE